MFRFWQMYCWLHETFRFLTTRNQAYDLVMENLMDESLLETRFDRDRVHRLLTLWTRLCDRFRRFIHENKGIVHVDCTEVTIPFPALEKATLIQLLSEGDHMTDGNDYILLIVNDIVQQYNGFIGKIEEIVGDTNKLSSRTIHPRLISSVCGASALLDHPSKPIGQSLTWVAECSWEESSDDFNLNTMSRLMKLFVNPRLNRIGNPTTLLREKFCFRREEESDSDGARMECEINHVGGVYFANRQDYELADELLSGLTERDRTITSALNLNFRTLGYADLRTLLEGCRNCFALWSNEYDGLTLRNIIDLSSSKSSAEGPTGALNQHGFPCLSSSQERFLLGLNLAGLAELVQFVTYQLGSESYHYAALPQRLSYRLQENSQQQLLTSIQARERMALSQTVAEIEDFTENVLSYYESLIVEASSIKNWSLCDYLHKNNFCDRSDPIFSLIPTTCTLRNYIHLRQILHQKRLSLLFTAGGERSEKSVSFDEEGFPYSHPTKAIHWLWKEEGDNSESPPERVQSKNDRERSWRLWFEDLKCSRLPDDAKTPPDHDTTCMALAEDTPAAVGQAVDPSEADLKRPDKSSMTEVTAKDTVSPDKQRFCAAWKIQRWWRRELTMMDITSCATESSQNTSAPWDDISTAVRRPSGLTRVADKAEDYLTSTEEIEIAFTPEDESSVSTAEDVDSDELSRYEKLYSAARRIQHWWRKEWTMMDIVALDESDVSSGWGSAAGIRMTWERDQQRPQGGTPCLSIDLQEESLSEIRAHPNVSNETSRANTSKSIIHSQDQTGEDEHNLRRWLVKNRLPLSTLDDLAKLGVRSTEDLQMVVEECPELLSSFKPLDQHKLKRGFQGSNDS